MSDRNIIFRMIAGLWHGLDGVRKILHFLLLLIVFLAFFGALSDAPPILPKRAALVIQPTGPLVEQLDHELCGW